MKELRNKVRSYEAAKTGNQNENQIQPSKNGMVAQREVGQEMNEINDITEMKTFLAGVMSAITAFDAKLSKHQEQSQTLMDRS